MKRTSYIILGVLLGGLLLMSGTIFYISKYGLSRDDYELYFTEAPKTFPLPECKVLKIFVPRKNHTMNDDVKIKEASFAGIPLEISPAHSSASGSISFAADLKPFVSITSVEDTVTVSFAFPPEKLDKKFADRHWLSVNSQTGMTLSVPSGVQHIVSNTYDQKTTFRGFECDSLSLSFSRSYGPIVIEKSHFRSLHIQSGNNWHFKSGSAENIYLNLDAIGNWAVNTESFCIDTEYLSGSHNSYCTLQKNECRQMLWTPLTQKATLNVELKAGGKVQLIDKPQPTE
ncbi:hypothetical protein JN06_02541 [Bacteroides zoogleoformans]|uniref:Adhesin domain-containing protein n=1 Tax=Bacteroides zoogleoformans TaxID=28119 RepID=A0ABM6T7L0_9BACE|nr:hypothetical protein [Bacteroides zoogleoformans]AVM52832.1 hypothetical protein C4H11_07690 [Bacteroides zoogleoformans]TWJ10969.1 hypothetical protein JN06_02541 [Bacteroides zoogleoformans]